MHYCSVQSCKNNSSCENVLFFSFPNTEHRAEWIKFTKKEGWIPAKNSKICSNHFSSHLINAKNCLRKGAIPSLQGAEQLSQKVAEGEFKKNKSIAFQ
jgi:hypothetical protein